MGLLSSRELLADAKWHGYAVPAFNFENLEMAQAISRAAAAARCPVILQTTPSTVRYIGLEAAKGIAEGVAAQTGADLALHLDHGDSLLLLKKAAAAGYSSVMIDGSRLPLTQNIALTRRARALCGGIPLEAELGRVGGKEDDLADAGASWTDPDEAAAFVEQTGVDSLAVGVGTAHGIYQGTPCIQMALISALSALLPVPLVLHGASGLKDEVVRECIRRGMQKVNFATELRIAFSDGAREALRADEKAFDPKKYLAAARERVEALAAEKIALCYRRG